MEQTDFIRSPSVGIFWGIKDSKSPFVFACAAVALDEAEPYGDCLGYPNGHLEVWTHWQTLGDAGLKQRNLPAAVLWHEYEDFPRGRVVYTVPDHTFMIYADRRLQTDDLIAQIMRLFCLSGQSVVVRADAHYRT